VLLNHASSLLRARHVRESLELFDRALTLGVDPVTIGGERWTAAMLLGRFETAWEVSDLVLRRTDPVDLNRADRPFHQRAVWDGRPLDGHRVLIRCYHGLGDIVQFARYLPLVARRARNLTVQAPEAMHGLLAGIAGVGMLYPLGDEVALPPHEVQAELMELPFVFRTTLDSLPAEVPYLRVDPARVAAQATRLKRRGRLAVGLAWAAGAWDGGHRSLPVELVERLMAMPDVDWVCLQRGPPLTDAGRLPFCDRGIRSDDPLDTAAMIAALDLVISVDTMVAHLAGALGAPVWTLLRYEADWRWMVERDDSPWYPTMCLFRQPTPGVWEPVIARVAEALASLPSR
jgi:hypothetical protein